MVRWISGGFEFMSQRLMTLRLGLSSIRSGFLIDDFSSDFIAAVSGGVGLKFQKIILDIGFKNLGPTGFAWGFSIIKQK